MTSFFDEREEQSRVKAEIVADYFDAWSRIMARQSPRVGYFDFYAGPGRYKDGEKSTPLLILERAIASADLRPRLVSIFNDLESDFTETLEKEIDALPGIETLGHKPQVITGAISDELIKEFEDIQTIPALSFIDPWGYKGLSMRLIRSVIKDFGCEAIFFFNYNRINMGVSNNLVEPHMAAIFGAARLEALQALLPELSPEERENRIRRELGEALEEMGAPYLIPFRFLRDSGRVSHYICFVSKHPLGYWIMKSIMASKGIKDEDGVPTFEYLPQAGGKQLIFGIERPILRLPSDLLTTFAGRSVTVQSIMDEHNVGTPFIEANYKQVLKELEAQGAIECDPPASKRRRNTLANATLVRFPRQ